MLMKSLPYLNSFPVISDLSLWTSAHMVFYPENRIWDDSHAGSLLGMWFQEAGVRDKENEPGGTQEPVQERVTEPATVKGDWCSITKNILLSLWNIFHNFSPRGQKEEECIHQLSCPADPVG